MSVGYKVMQVVSGNASVYIHVTAIKKWDICAGDAVLSEWGGTMTSLTGEEVDYNAAAPVVNTNGLLVTRDRHKEYAEQLYRALQKDLHL